MTDRVIHFVAHDPLRYEPVRDKAGEPRRFSKDGARAFMRRHLPKYGTLFSSGYGSEPIGQLEAVGLHVFVTGGQYDTPYPTTATASGT